jgi:hypothetical protein
VGSIWLRWATVERMQNPNHSHKISEEPGSRIPDTSRQRSPGPGLAPASIIDRAAQRLDWTIRSGMQHGTPRGLSRGGGRRLSLIFGLCASVLIVAAVGSGIFLLTHSAEERAASKGALATDAPAKVRQATSLSRGLAIMPPAAATAQSATLAEPAPTAAASSSEAKLTLGPLPLPPGWPQPNVAAPPGNTLEATSTFGSPAPQNWLTVPTLSGAEIAWLLARGDWLFATGDVGSARLLYERAADAGEARAAARLGETFDPTYLGNAHLRGVQGDPEAAMFWYRHARDLGATGVASRLKRLEAKEARN